MMYGQGKSDSPIVPMKSPNNAAPAAAEAMEGRGGAKGNAVRGSTCQTQSWESVSPALDRIRETARRDKRVRFTALLHHVTVDLLRWSFYQLKRRAAAGIDGVTWDQYETGLEGNLADLYGRVQRGAYRAKPSRRQYIPKPDGRQRPLGIAALEDKIVQRAVVEILNAIYETDFLGFSYGFRPGRSQHRARSEIVLRLGPEAHLVQYPLRRGSIINLVATINAPSPADGAADPSTLEQAFAGWSKEARALIGAPAQWRAWPLYCRPPIRSFSLGRAALVGDAAHPMVPFLAQGAAQAIEDAGALGRAVAQMRDIPTALAAYSHDRVERAARVQREALRQGRIYHLAGTSAFARDMTMKILGPRRLAERYDWLYGA